MNWISEMFNKSLNKTAEQTNSQQEFTKKVKASGWVDGVMGIDEPAMAKEADAKMEAEIAIRKEAAYEPFQTTEETLKHDYKRDVEILSDFTLASMIAEVRGHAKQDFMENATEYFETAKKNVKSDREAVEKELLEATGMSAQLDWRKSFEQYKKDETPKQADEKELYNAKLKDVNDDLSKGGKVDAYAETDEQHAKTMLGVGREEKERTNVTAQPGEVHKDASLSKKAEAPFFEDFSPEAQQRIIDNVAAHLGTSNTEEIDDWINVHNYGSALNEALRGQIVEASLKTSALVRDPDVELKVGSIIRLARSIMSHEGQILNEGTNWEITGIDGYHYTLSANGQKHVISSHDTPKFNKIASQEIENHATKEQVIQKLAEIDSPWAVRVDKEGKEVIALIAPENSNTKESEEENTNLNK